MGEEFNEAVGNHTIDLMKHAIAIAYEKYSSVTREVNTDKGLQFYCNKNDNQVNRGKAEFESNSLRIKELITSCLGEITCNQMGRMKDGSEYMKSIREDIKPLINLLILPNLMLNEWSRFWGPLYGITGFIYG